MENCNAHSEPFLSFLPFICAEKGIVEPSDPAERERIWESIPKMNSACALGPLVKIMRWFSWYESEQFYQGENFMNKLVMMMDDSGKRPDPIKGVDFVKVETLDKIEEKGNLSEKQQLQQLKFAHGTWALAPQLITPSSVWQKDLVAVVGAQAWLHHSRRAKHVLTPQQVCDFSIGKARGGWKDELLDLMNDAFYNPGNLKRLYPPGATTTDVKVVRMHVHYQLISKLLGKRCSSLLAFFMAPPLRYSPLLLQDWKVASQIQMDADWKLLLRHEELHLEGQVVHGLEALQFLQSAYCRLMYLLNEQDLLSGNASNQASLMMEHALKHFGDTACIESTHSSAKDSLRDARGNFRSRVGKYFHCISSRVLQSRQTPHITISDAALATAKVKTLPSVVVATHPSSHTLNKQFQSLMKHKAGDHFWHATTATSQFHQVVPMEWLLAGHAVVKNPVLSCLAGESGSVVACKSTGDIWMVLVASPYGFVGWRLEVAVSAGAMGTWPAYIPVAQPSAIQVQFVCSVDDEWCDIPITPQTKGNHGSLILLQNGEKESLLKARVKAGLTLTVVQAKACITFLGHNIGQVPKAQVYQKLIELVLDSPEERGAAFAKSAVGNEDADDLSDTSEYEELLKLVEEDAENRNDPDLKAERRKVQKKKRAKAAAQSPPDDLMKRGRGRGRGKGKGKGKGKTEPKAKSAKPWGRGRGRGRGRKNKQLENSLPEAPASEALPALPESPAPVESAPQPALPKDSLPEAPAPVESEPPAEVVPVDSLPDAFAPVESEPQPALPKDSLPEAPAPVESEPPAEVVPKDSLPEAPAPVESEPPAEVVPKDSLPEAPAPVESEPPAEVVPKDSLHEAPAPVVSEPPAEVVPKDSLPEAPAPAVSEPQPALPADVLPEAPAPVVSVSSLPEEPAPPPASLPEALVPEEPLNDSLAHPAVPRLRGPNVFSSPDVLERLSPPGCHIRLN